MQKVYNISYINSKNGRNDESQLNADDEKDLYSLIETMRKELEIGSIISIEAVGVVRYYICAIGYDKDDKITDYEIDFGDFDTYGDAYREFIKLQCADTNTFFQGKTSDIMYVKLQLEECEEVENAICCIDVTNETDIYKEVK